MSHLYTTNRETYGICLSQSASHMDQIEQLCRTNFPGNFQSVAVVKSSVCLEFDSIEAAYNAMVFFQNTPVGGHLLECKTTPSCGGASTLDGGGKTIANGDTNAQYDYDTSQVYLAALTAYNEKVSLIPDDSNLLKVGTSCGIYVTDVCSNTFFLGIENKSSYTKIFRNLKNLMDNTSKQAVSPQDAFICIADESEGLSRGFIVKTYKNSCDVYLIDWGYVKTYKLSELHKLTPRALSFVRPLAKLFEIAGAPSDMLFPELLSLPLLFNVKVMAVSADCLTFTVKVKFNGHDLIDYYYDSELVQQACVLDSSQRSGESSTCSVEEWLLNTDDANMSHIIEGPPSPPDDEALANLIESVDLGDSVSAINHPNTKQQPSLNTSYKFTFLSTEMILKTGTRTQVLITYVVLPTFFNFIPINARSDSYRLRLKQELDECIKSGAPTMRQHPDRLNPRNPGKCVIINKEPYRVVIKSKLVNFDKHGLMRIQQVDYGTEIIVGLDDIYQLQSSLSHIPALRCNGLLHGLQANEPKRWSPEECCAFRQIVEGKVFDAEVIRVNTGTPAPSYYLDIYIPGTKLSVTRLMHSFGFGAPFKTK